MFSAQLMVSQRAASEVAEAAREICRPSGAGVVLGGLVPGARGLTPGYHMPRSALDPADLNVRGFDHKPQTPRDEMSGGLCSAVSNCDRSPFLEHGGVVTGFAHPAPVVLCIPLRLATGQEGGHRRPPYSSLRHSPCLPSPGLPRPPPGPQGAAVRGAAGAAAVVPLPWAARVWYTSWPPRCGSGTPPVADRPVCRLREQEKRLPEPALSPIRTRAEV
jgi:hypothetical protein